jgi:hypothetical protein
MRHCLSWRRRERGAGATSVSTDRVRHQVRAERDLGPRHLTIAKGRPPWREDTGPERTRLPIARPRPRQATRRRSLYWRDRSLRFRVHDRLAPSPHIGSLLREIQRDPTAIFWGAGRSGRGGQHRRCEPVAALEYVTGREPILAVRLSSDWHVVPAETRCGTGLPLT